MHLLFQLWTHSTQEIFYCYFYQMRDADRTKNNPKVRILNLGTLMAIATELVGRLLGAAVVGAGVTAAKATVGRPFVGQ